MWAPAPSEYLEFKMGPILYFQTARLLLLFSLIPLSCCMVPESFTRASKCLLLLGNMFVFLHNGLPFISMLFGSFAQNDGSGSRSAWLQWSIRLRTLAHMAHGAEGHTANMGFSSLCLEGSSASCSPWLPTALHSAIANDGLMAKFTGQQAMWLLQSAIRREGKVELQGVWKCSSSKSDIFSYLLGIKSPYSSQNRYLTLGSFRVNGSVNIKIHHTVDGEHENPLNQKSYFFFIQRILTFSLAFLFVPASIHSFSFSSMSIKAHRTPSINSSIYKKIPKEASQNQEASDKVFWAMINSPMLNTVEKKLPSDALHALAEFFLLGKCLFTPLLEEN